MKVFVAIKYKPFCDVEYVGVASSQKKALEILKKHFPYMRGSISNKNLSSDKNNTYLLSVIEEEI